MARRDEYDEVQAARRLKVPVTTWRWARRIGLVPEPDVSAWQWSRAAVEALDAGAVRAAEPRELVSPWEAGNRLAQALGTPNEADQVPAVSGYAVERLIALGLLLDLSRDHKYPKLNPAQVAELSTRADLPEILARETPLGPEQAADRLGVRRVDFEWMRRLGWIEPVSYSRVQFGATKAGAAHVPRFSTGHIDDLPQQHPDIDWPALRTLGKGQHSPLAALCTGRETASS
ncbi:hypothetical protein DY245_43190 [Streptomyces inhibens]|uniref:Uncharacterized protein n=1 Tax=Streptomyces inhibens TaxID=2293571 RepID=A0A371PQK3_STRIH|nr:hypothetical protein [Streptomyces inhibens]REK84461.1 hypothetical protein DY245_43190 [Streptomyces inhibens]